MKEEQLKKDYGLILDYWKFWKSHSNLDTDVSAWATLTDDCSRFCSDHESSALSADLMTALAREMGSRAGQQDIHSDQRRQFGLFMADFWQFTQRYFVTDPDANAPYWSQLMNDAGELGRKYGETKWATNLIIAFVDYLGNDWYRPRRKE